MIDGQPKRTDVPPPWQPRFSLQGLFLLTLVVCAMGTAGAYFVRSISGTRHDRFMFILFTLAAPPVLVIVVSALAYLVSRRR